MAVRTAMSSVIDYTKGLIGMTQSGKPNTVSNTPFTDEQIQEALDQHRLQLEWVLLDNDPDFRHYYSRAYRTHFATTRTFVDREITMPDFSLFTRVGFYESDFVIREDRIESSSAHTPDLSNFVDGTFVFSTPPNKLLFIFGHVYNVYQASADLLMRTPDFGRIPLKSASKFGITENYALMDKIKMYRGRGRLLNRRIPRVFRG